jgi:hypothetical protein
VVGEFYRLSAYSQQEAKQWYGDETVAIALKIVLLLYNEFLMF